MAVKRDVEPAGRKHRRSAAEVANDLIMAEQAAIAEGARVAEGMAAVARQEWEAERALYPPPLINHQRFTWSPGSE